MNIALSAGSAAATTFPLSSTQAEIWYAQRLDPDDACYNLGRYVEIFGAIEPALFATAVRKAVHEIDGLRIGFVETDSGPRQFFRHAEDVSVPYFDVSGKEDPRAAAEAWMRADMARPFDLKSDLLFRYALFKAADDRFFWYEVNHHLINDVFGFALVERRVAEIYRGLLDGAPPETETPPSLLDLVEENQAYELSQLDRDKQFWLAQLADRPDPVTLSGRAPAWTVNVIHSAGALTRTAAAALERAGKAHGASLFAALAAAAAVYLSRVTGARDVVLGMPVAGRTSRKMRSVVGAASNIVPLRLRVDPRATFGDLLEQSGRRTREALRHQRCPVGALRQDLGLAANESDMYGTLINFLPIDENLDFSGLSIRKHNLGNWRVNDLEIVVNAGVRDEDFQIELWANRAHYDAQALDSHLQRLVRLLETVADDPEKTIAHIAMLSDAERGLLRAWNATEAAYPRDRIFARVFEDQAARTPDAVAVSFEGAAWSYAELNARANAVAHRLRALGVGPGALVAICAPRSPALLAALLGVQKSGGAYVPLDPDYPPQRLEFMLADSGAKALITADRAADGLRPPDGVAIVDLDALSEAGAADNPTGSAGPQDTAYVIYTSGSTGAPKGVAVSHGALMNFLCSMRENPGLTADDVLAAVTTVSFDIAALELYLPLMVGARIELASRATATDGQALAELIATSGASVLQATPSTWRMLVEAGWSGRPGFRALSGGEALSRNLADALLARVDKLWNLYGPTETTVWSTLDLVERDGAPVAIGRPIANTQVHILDAAGELAPIGVAGEICIGGEGVADGYLGRPDLTAERFIPDPLSERPGARLYRTGDLGSWGADGKLRHLGRLDSQVKIRGFRVEIEEIEAALRGHEDVRDAAVAVREAQAGDQKLVAYLVYQEGEDLTATEIRRYLRARLPDFMIPSIVMSLESLPLTANGKTDRAALPDPFRTTPHAAVEHDPPVTGAEQLVAEIWRSVLAVERISADDNFFELGGHSLLSLRVARAIEQRTGYRIDPRTLFFHTLRQVAAMLPSQAASAHPPVSRAIAR